MFCKVALASAVLVALAVANPTGPHEMPAFLQGVSAEAQKEFMDIVQNESSTIAQQRTEIKAWADKNQLGSKMEEIEKDLKEKAASIEQAAADSKIPTDKLNELKTIFTNEEQTRKQQMDALKEFKEKNPEIAENLKNIIMPILKAQN